MPFRWNPELTARDVTPELFFRRRRQFIQQSALLSAGVALGGLTPAVSLAEP
ncbi:MAG: twin-arginine translocation signal domain-containing protein, partial [Magnetococcales bacterium]|nr:twin-arginine translocation signal domain-containing protein [Magnetococcales bacterium]